jgi:hypothetical protein
VVVGNMASANDAINAAVAAPNRIDAVELQLTGIAQQLQLLLGGGGGAGGGGPGGGGGAGGGDASQRRRIDTSCLEKLHGDASLAQFRSWRNRWNDFCHLNQLNAYPVNEQMAAFRMALDPAMQQVVEVALGILPTSPLSPSDVIDRITDHVRSKRNIALDRVAFDECRQHTSESFDDFYIRLRTLANAADMCAACLDSLMATRIMAGIRDTETRRKLLALSPFPTGQQAINICRSDKSAKASEKSLNHPPSVAQLHSKSQRPDTASDNHRCGSCGQSAHRANDPCPATGKQCHRCGGMNHFSPCCSKNRKPEKTEGAGAGGGSSGGHGNVGTSSSGTNSRGDAGSSRPRSHMQRVVIATSVQNVVVLLQPSLYSAVIRMGRLQ